METPLIINAFDVHNTLDPHRAFDTAARHPVLNIYDSLLAIADDNTVVPSLADQLPTVRERQGEWWASIPIRSGVRFHDGSTLGVEDVVYSLRRGVITADGPSSLWSDALLGTPLTKITTNAAIDMIHRIQATADGVWLRMSAPYSPLGALLVQWSLIVNKAWCAGAGEWDGEPQTVDRFVRPDTTWLDDHTNGTGPYAMHQWLPDRGELHFQRHENYWGAPAEPTSVVLRSVDDRLQRERELLAGECDFAVCQPESRDRLGILDGIVLEKLPDEWSINPLGFITQRLDPECPAVGSGVFGPGGLRPDAFTDPHLRRMLSLCFDEQRFVEEVLDGEGIRHRAPFPRPALPASDASGIPFDLGRARQELELAWDGQVARDGCRIVLYTHATNISRVKAADILADGLRAVSDRIVVVVEPVDMTDLARLLYSSQCPVAWVGWACDFLHPYALASTLLDGRAPLPTALGIRDERLQQLVTLARGAAGPDEFAVYQSMADHAQEQALFLSAPGKISYMTHSDKWWGVRLKNQVPNVLDFASFRLRELA
ncbi:ABC transporter substrate-binding protein [Streptomyces sp. NBC_01794]|uniref:ABC transporter substrate-binding protein n=1 Tax=Streptomyces sp. NBC_01794 TaxID=2975942 RepID=UPI0030930076|nr:ABC transporter substrate-binding protein [Streptomyces sp. NBC_01794]